MTQKPMLGAEVGRECACVAQTKQVRSYLSGGGVLAKIIAKIAKSEAFLGSAHSAETIKRKARERSW